MPWCAMCGKAFLSEWPRKCSFGAGRCTTTAAKVKWLNPKKDAAGVRAPDTNPEEEA